MRGPNTKEQTMLKMTLLALSLALSVTAASASENTMSYQELLTLEKVRLLVKQKEIQGSIAKTNEHSAARCPLLLDEAAKSACSSGFEAVKSVYRTLLDQTTAMLASLSMPEGAAKSYLLRNAFNPEEFNLLLAVSQRQIQALNVAFPPSTHQLGAIQEK